MADINDNEYVQRIGDMHSMNVRLSLLESKHSDILQNQEHHDKIIDRLLDQDKQAVLALNAINSKFDTIIAQFSFGFKVACVFCVLVSSLTGAFWVYSHDLESKFQYHEINALNERK